jgi:hypothetical protein
MYTVDTISDHNAGNFGEPTLTANIVIKSFIVTN